MLKGEVKRLYRAHFEICKLAEGDQDLAHVWNVIEQMGIQLPETRSKTQLLLLSFNAGTLTNFSNAGFDTLDLKTLEGLGIAKIRSTQQQPFKHTAGTCHWIETRQFFKDWLTNSDPKRLWISGSIGSGKTYLARHVVDLVDSGGTLAYCSLVDITTGYKTPKSVLVWLMYEILSTRRELIARCLTAFYQRESGSQGDNVCDWPFLSVKRLWETLVGALKPTDGGASGQRGTIVLDGIDQCLGGPDELKRLRELFVCITEGHAFRVLIFSRPSSDLVEIQQQRGFQMYSLNEKDTKEDVSATVREGAYWIARLHSYGREVQEKIVENVGGKAKGMYLWATMVLEELKRQPLPPSQLDEFLNNLPPTIIELYDLILGRVGTPNTGISGAAASGVTSFVRHVLFWIAYQLHEMNEEEMWTGISLLEAAEPLLPQSGARRITEADVRAMPHTTNLKREISRGCGALVTWTENDTFVVAHPSVREFLVTPTETLRRRYPRLRHHQTYYCGGLQPDNIIRQLCTSYLLLRYFSEPKDEEPSVSWVARVQRRVEEYPFSRYTARSWLKHANMSDHQVNLSGNAEFTAGSDQQRLLAPEDIASRDLNCSRSWMEIWWYYEKPGQEFPADGISLESFGSGESLPPRVQWVTSDDARDQTTPSPLPRTARAAPPLRTFRAPAPAPPPQMRRIRDPPPRLRERSPSPCCCRRFCCSCYRWFCRYCCC